MGYLKCNAQPTSTRREEKKEKKKKKHKAPHSAEDLVDELVYTPMASRNSEKTAINIAPIILPSTPFEKNSQFSSSSSSSFAQLLHTPFCVKLSVVPYPSKCKRKKKKKFAEISSFDFTALECSMLLLFLP